MLTVIRFGNNNDARTIVLSSDFGFGIGYLNHSQEILLYKPKYI